MNLPCQTCVCRPSWFHHRVSSNERPSATPDIWSRVSGIRWNAAAGRCIGEGAAAGRGRCSSRALYARAAAAPIFFLSPGTFSPGSLPYGDACSISAFNSAPIKMTNPRTYSSTGCRMRRTWQVGRATTLPANEALSIAELAWRSPLERPFARSDAVGAYREATHAGRQWGQSVSTGADAKRLATGSTDTLLLRLVDSAYSLL
jgi:hypothetical protein